MSEQQNNNVRVVLGPVARALIDGARENRQQALDDAITQLMEGRDATSTPNFEPVETKGKDAGTITGLESLKRMLSEHQDIMLAEMKMTRLMVNWLMKRSDQDNEALREMTGQVVRRIVDDAMSISKDTKAWLMEIERKYEEMERQEMDRLGALQKSWKEPELER